MGWSCTACTYRNLNDGAKACLTCDTKREKKATTSMIAALSTTSTSSATLADDGDGRAAKKRSAATMQQQRLGFGGKKAKATSSTSGDTKLAAAQQQQQQSASQISKKPSALASYREISHDDDFSSRKIRCAEVMKKVFEVDELRHQQPKAIKCALKGKSQIIVMATGGGKSLCYQLPAVVCGGTTVVISPLIALMRDQVASLLKKGVLAACINSSNKEKENKEILERLMGRSSINGQTATRPQPLTLVYVTPESLQTSKFQTILQELYKKKQLAGFAIDEAHCLSTWGHDFRPAYRKLDYIATRFPTVPRMALTATATKEVIHDIKKTLQLETCHLGSFDRPNIFYKVHYKDALDAISNDGALVDLAKFISKQHKRATKAGEPCSGIIYVHKRDDTTSIAKEITKKTGILAGAYHGAMKDADRNKVQEDWTSGAIQIAVATVAFGMGIDLAHVRYVVHWAIPKTMDGFYQESGRGGRDGLPAISLVYFSRTDTQTFAFLIKKQTENSKKDREASEASVKRKLEALQQVEDYCMTAQCRRQYVLKHFGEKETDPKTVCKKACDFCSNPERIEKAINASDAMRAVGMQRKQEAKRKKNTKAWDGQWSGPHGEQDDVFEGHKEDWEVEGLGITSSGTSNASKRSNFNSTSFVSAKTLKDKLNSLEAMELQDNENNGFVRFKSVSNNERRPRDPFPEHMRAKLERIPMMQNIAKKPPERSSSEIAASAGKMKAELAALKARSKALKDKATKARAVAPPPPPPPSFQATTSKQRK